MNAADDGYIPFKTRFIAWWEGVDPAYLMRKQRKKAGLAVEQAAIVIEEPVEDAADDSPDLDSLMSIREAVWGKGFVVPSGLEATHALAAPAGLEEGMSVLWLGAGLGGGCRAVAEEWGVQVEGLEADGAMVEEALGRIKTKVGVATVSISKYMPNNARLKVNRFKCALAQEAFFDLIGKEVLLEKIWNSLQEDSHLLFTDLVYATEYATDETPILEWRDSETRLPDCWTIERYKETLTGIGFSVQEVTDESDWYSALIGEKWLAFVDLLSGREIERRYVDLVMHEAQLWQTRVKALKSGQLRYFRIHAYRVLDKDIK